MHISKSQTNSPMLPLEQFLEDLIWTKDQPTPEQSEGSVRNNIEDDDDEMMKIDGSNNSSSCSVTSDTTDTTINSSLDEEFNNSIGNISSSSSIVVDDRCHRNSQTKRIGFSSVEVIEFNIMIGDDRQCDYPMTLSWVPCSLNPTVMDIKDFEEERQEQKRQRQNKQNQKPRKRKGERSSSACRLSSSQRRDKLKHFGYSEADLIQIHRKRQVRLSIDYAYGCVDRSCMTEAANSFEEQQYRYIV